MCVVQDQPGMKIGVIGLGGLGHMAVKWGKAFGCEVCVAPASQPAALLQ